MYHDLIYCPQYFLDTMERIEFKSGDIIVRHGDAPSFIYIVLEGIASVKYISSKGKYLIASQFINGDYIGEMNAIAKQNYILDATALTDMTLLKIPSDTFIEYMQKDFRMVESMVQSQNNRINFLEAYSIISKTFSLYERTILFFCGPMRIEAMRRHFSKDFLVEYMGSDIRCINRVLGQLKKNNLVSIVNGKVAEYDIDKFMKEACRCNIDYYAELFFDMFGKGVLR